MTNEQLKFLERDLNFLLKENFHNRHYDLINMCINEDVMKLIEFVKNVNEVFNNLPLNVEGQYNKGYLDGILQIKKEIYE